MSVKSDIEEYFKDVFFVVEATSCEQQFLWEMHHDSSNRSRGHIEKWEPEGRGLTAVVGHVKRMPVQIVIWYVRLNGKRVAFWEPTSQMVDHRMIGDWLAARTSHIKDKNGSIAQTDAINFHRVIHAVTPPDPPRGYFTYFFRQDEPRRFGERKPGGGPNLENSMGRLSDNHMAECVTWAALDGSEIWIVKGRGPGKVPRRLV